MNKLNKIILMYHQDGIKKTIQFSLQKAIGIEKHDDRINSGFFFMNNYFNISQFPKAEGPLGLLQKGDTILLEIVDIICKKYSLEYWLDAGTFLGAVRHKGFIPWDDDMDLCMMRDVYERALPILSSELGKYGIDAVEKDEEPIGHIGVGYNHNKTGLWIDIFPNEYTTIDPSNPDAISSYQKRWSKWQKQWKKKGKKFSREQMFEYRKKYIPEICSSDQAKSIAYCPEFGTNSRLWRIQDVFPTMDIMFEGKMYPAPNNVDNYLVQFYGKNYFHFPQGDLAHHGQFRGNLETWAEKNGINMMDTISELEEILEAIQHSMNVDTQEAQVKGNFNR